MAAAGYEVKHGRGGAVSFRTEGQERYTRLRSSTLGKGYGQEDIIAVIEGEYFSCREPCRSAPQGQFSYRHTGKKIQQQISCRTPGRDTNLPGGTGYFQERFGGGEAPEDGRAESRGPDAGG